MARVPARDTDGLPRADLGFFRPDYLHRELGLNLICPVLPIHGPRRVGPVSGDRILSGDVMDSLHAASQAMWDARRLILWLRRNEGAPAIGVTGHSRVRGSVALVSRTRRLRGRRQPGRRPVAFVLAQRPLPLDALSQDRWCDRGEDECDAAPDLPLALEPLLGRERRAIFAGVADRVVPATEAASLWRRWEEPRIVWYQGTHNAFLGTIEGRTLLATALREAGIVRPRP